MALQFIKKRFRKKPEYKTMPQNLKKGDGELMVLPQEKKAEIEEVKTVKAKNNKKNHKEDMINKDKIKDIEDAIENMQPEVKVVKTDRGLIERTESSKIIITEDNRQILND